MFFWSGNAIFILFAGEALPDDVRGEDPDEVDEEFELEVEEEDEDDEVEDVTLLPVLLELSRLVVVTDILALCTTR